MSENGIRIVIRSFYKKTWVFFNFAQLNENLIPLIVANCNYFIVEYDYKFCKFRSIELHKSSTGEDCNCHNSQRGKIISAFFAGSTKIFWMSDEQKQRYQERFPFLTNEMSVTLSSIFDVKDLEYIEKLRNARKSMMVNENYVILNSNSSF